MLEAARFIYTHDDDGIDVNFFTASEAEIAMENRSVRLKQVTTYPSEYSVRIEVEPEAELSFSLRIRIPRWTRGFRLTINGEPFDTAPEQGYASIRRSWKPGDVLAAEFHPYLRLVPGGTTGFSTQSKGRRSAKTDQMERAAILYGPLVLMLDRRAEILIARRESGEVFLPRSDAPIPGRGELFVPGMCFMTLARDLDGKDGPAELNDESWKLGFLVPISEITDRSHELYPYEVRNDVRVLEKEQTGDFVTRVQGMFKYHGLRDSAGPIHGRGEDNPHDQPLRSVGVLRGEGKAVDRPDSYHVKLYETGWSSW